MITAIVMMAGNATRMHIEENKVFLPLGDKLVFQYSLDLFLSYSFEVICVVRKEDRHRLRDYEGKVKIVYGGKTRQESVFHGLKEATGDYTLIHDAARPFVTKRVVDCCIEAFKNQNACLVVSACKDSIYQRIPLKALQRDELVLAQTPQGGKTKDLLEVHQKAIEEGLQKTDDISLLLNYKDTIIKMIENDDSNFKITTQLDYITAKELILHA